MTDALKSVPPVVIARFGHPRAKPRVVSVYDPNRGWSDDYRRGVVTGALVEELRSQGFTLIEAKWRREVRQLNLFLIPAAEVPPRRRSAILGR